MTDKTQSRKWLLTINNPTDHAITRETLIALLMSMTLQYFCFAFERGKKSSLEHVHLFLYSGSPIRFYTVKRVFPMAHIDKAYGSVKDNRDYVGKTGKWEGTDKEETQIKGSFYEQGDMPTERDEKDPLFSQFLKEVDNGANLNELIDKYPRYLFKVKDIEILIDVRSRRNIRDACRDMTVTYIYGEDESNIIRNIYASHPGDDICRIVSYKLERALFDGYFGQKILIFANYDSQISIADMNCFLDGFPVDLPARYRNRYAQYTTVYIVSSSPLDRQYKSEQVNDRSAWNTFLDRINFIRRQIDVDTQIELSKEDFYA